MGEEYSQPYGNAEFAFVFNGHLQGVKINKPVAGLTGAEKIWTLIKEELAGINNTESAVELVRSYILTNTNKN